MEKILAFAGSNSSESINQKFLHALAPHFSVYYEVVSLRDFEAPLFGVDLKNSEGVPASIMKLSKLMEEADGFVISAAEHNGSMAAVLKNTFDWLSMIHPKFFLSKPTVFLSASPGGRGGQSVLKHLLEIMPHRGSEIVGSYGLGFFHEKYSDNTLIEAVHEEVKPLIIKLKEAIKLKSNGSN